MTEYPKSDTVWGINFLYNYALKRQTEPKKYHFVLAKINIKETLLHGSLIL